MLCIKSADSAVSPIPSRGGQTVTRDDVRRVDRANSTRLQMKWNGRQVQHVVPKLALFVDGFRDDGFQFQTNHPITDRVDFGQHDVFVLCRSQCLKVGKIAQRIVVDFHHSNPTARQRQRRR